MTRRDFLTSTCGLGAGLLLPACARRLAGEALGTSAAAGQAPHPTSRKIVVVVFGGGTRYSESIGDPGHQYTPRLWNELVPRGTLFTNVRVEGRVVHTNCTASILTGHREYDADNDWSRPVEHPTLFEIVRRARSLPDTAVWAFVYASILAQVGYSRTPGYGLPFAANVVEPPTIPRETAERIAARFRAAALSGSPEEERRAAAEAAQWARAESHLNLQHLRSPAARRFIELEYAAWKTGQGTTSHDAFLCDCALACLREFTPDVLTVAFGEIDCAHYGSWSRYTDAIRRTDDLTGRLWDALKSLDAYKGQTLLVVLPDHGRELERPDGLGYVHHSNFYTQTDEDEGCRRTWMLLLGPGVATGRTVETPVPQTAVTPTALKFLGLPAPTGSVSSLL